MIGLVIAGLVIVTGVAIASACEKNRLENRRRNYHEYKNKAAK
jgi:hypothetical protein